MSSPTSGNGRLYALLLLLAVLCGAFGFDRAVAKKGIDDAFDKVKTFKRDKTQKDVHAAIGKEPSNKEELDDGVILETYSWIRGIPFLRYKMFVAYHSGVVVEVSRGTAPTSFPGVSKANEGPPPTAGGRGGGGGKRGAGRKGGPPQGQKSPGGGGRGGKGKGKRKGNASKAPVSNGEASDEKKSTDDESAKKSSSETNDADDAKKEESDSDDTSSNH